MRRARPVIMVIYIKPVKGRQVKGHSWEGSPGGAHVSEMHITFAYMPQSRAQSQGQI